VNFTLDQLKAFLTSAETGSFSVASRKLQRLVGGKRIFDPETCFFQR
jgi:hypothetical protein